MLPVLFLLGGLGGLGAVEDVQLEPDFEKVHVQVTVPEKLESIIKEGMETQVSYKITVDEKAYIVKLQQKNFLPHNFNVYGYDTTGIMKPLDQELQNLCYYQGYVEDYPNSLVIASTCTGIRGLMLINNITYGIEPLESSVGFEHVLYQVKYKTRGVDLYAVKDAEFRNASYKIQTIQQAKISQYIEMHIVVEKQLYEFMGSDTTIVTQKIFNLIGLVNAMFSSLNITVILSSLELWKDENKLRVTGDVNELLYQFLKWKQSFLVLRPHDVAFLLVYREIENFVGATFQGRICDKDYGGGVALHPKTKGLESLGIILTQLLCLNMGIPYDDVSRCQCQGAMCVMNPKAIYSSGVRAFSNCSVAEFAHFISKQKSNCLQNQPRLQPSFRKKSVCGNRKVEEGEACDCGKEELCNAYPPVCCDHKTCQFTQGAKCDRGECCENCQFKEKGIKCRNAADQCDLNEQCNGSSGVCPENLYVLDGHPCEDGKWICRFGSCRSGIRQCSDTFGEDADFGTEECFEELNSKNDISGNCGSDAKGYKPCAPGDRKCGKLICQYNTDSIVQMADATIIYANISGKVCISLDFPHDHQQKTMMWVLDGTRCGTGKVCNNKKCVDTAFLNYDCTPETCNNNGVCNNKRQCHCNPPYLPPNCQVKGEDTEVTEGGDEDSDNEQPEENAKSYYIRQRYQSKSTKWPYFLMIPFFIILSVLIAILVKIQSQRKQWRIEDYISDEQLESRSESKE